MTLRCDRLGRRRRCLLSVAACAVACSVMAVAPAAAQSGAAAPPPQTVSFAAAPPPTVSPAAPLSERLSGSARIDYDDARVLLLYHDEIGALVRFRRVYAEVPDPRLLANMGLCEKNLQHFARAASFFQRALAEGAPLFTPTQTTQIQAMLDECLPRTARIRVAVDPPGAEVLVDDGSMGPAPLASDVLVDRGTHRIEVRKAGYRTAVRDVPVADAGPVAFPIKLEPLTPEGFLSVRTAADGVVSVDGKVVGKGPWQGAMAPGSHALRVTADGMATYRGDVLVRVNETETVDVRLQKGEATPVWLWVAGGAVAVVAVVVAAASVFHSSDPHADASATGGMRLSW
jgi:PEGA domain